MMSSEQNEFENVELYDQFYESRPAYWDVNNTTTLSSSSLSIDDHYSIEELLNNNNKSNEESLKNYVIVSLLENCHLHLPKQYDEVVYLGSGEQSVLCAARDRLTRKMVAIKKFDQPFKRPDCAERMIREFRILQFVNHPNVMNLLDAFPGNAQSLDQFEDVYLVTELMDHDLTIICNDNKNHLCHREIADIVYQILSGVQYLHRIGVVHGDLSPANIVVRRHRNDGHLELKIIDFSQTRSQQSMMMNDDQRQLLFSTRSYRAPEVILNMDNYFDYPIDIWSIGCIMAELINKDVLFRGISNLHQWKHIESLLGNPKETFIRRIRSSVRKILNGNRQQQRRSSVIYRRNLNQIFNKECDSNANNKDEEHNNEKAMDLLRRILVVDPRERITADEALKHEYFSIRNSILQQNDEEQEKMENICKQSIIEYREQSNNSIDTLPENEQHNQWKKLLFDKIRVFQHKNRQQIRRTLNSI